MKRLRFNTFHSRLLIWILLSTLVLLFGLTVLFYHYTTEQIDLKVGEAAQRNTSQAMDSFSLLARGFDSLTKSVMSNVEIQRLLSKEAPDEQEEFSKQLLMMGALGTIFYSHNDVKGIHIISNRGNVYSYESITHSINPAFLKGEWLTRLQQSDGTMVWGGMLEESLTVREDPVFTYGRLITNLITAQPLGVIIIEADPRTFLSSMNNLTINSKSRSYVFSDANQLLVSSHTDETLPESMLDLDQYEFDNKAVDASNESHLIVIAEEHKLGWKLLTLTPKPVAKLEQAEANRYFVLVTVVIVIITTLLAAFLSRSVSKPIKTIVNEMRRVERGDLTTQPKPTKSYDEMNYLNDHFNRMVSEINGLVERNKIVAASEKNAQIHALQSQVNPHFLYNTLEMIYWLLDEQQNEKLANLILSLSRMLRYSSDWRNSVASLEEELVQINHYMTIIEARSDRRIFVEHNIDEQWLITPLPKMTLQPLIENAVIHGLSGRASEGKISISLIEEGQSICILLRDNGVGIPDLKLKELQQSLKRAEQLKWNELLEEERKSLSAEPAIYGKSSGSGAGFLNVHRRMILEYGTGYGLQIESEVSIGTTVTIIVPIKKLRN